MSFFLMSLVMDLLLPLSHYLLHLWIWHTHTVLSELLPKTITTRLDCQCGKFKTNMHMLLHNILLYLCKTKFQFFLGHPDWIHPSFARISPGGIWLPSRWSARYLCEIATHLDGILPSQLHHLVLLNKEKNKNQLFTKLAFVFWLRYGSLLAVRTGLEPVTSGVTGRHSKPTELTHQVGYPVKSRPSRPPCPITVRTYRFLNNCSMWAECWPSSPPVLFLFRTGPGRPGFIHTSIATGKEDTVGFMMFPSRLPQSLHYII